MDYKKELKRQFKENKIIAGVYQIKNTVNNKVFIGSTVNLKSINGKVFQLDMRSHSNKVLQQEWKEFGKESFIVEILETLEPKDDEYFNLLEALKKLEEKWINTYQPFGEKGYN